MHLHLLSPTFAFLVLRLGKLRFLKKCKKHIGLKEALSLLRKKFDICSLKSETLDKNDRQGLSIRGSSRNRRSQFAINLRVTQCILGRHEDSRFVREKTSFQVILSIQLLRFFLIVGKVSFHRQRFFVE